MHARVVRHESPLLTRKVLLLSTGALFALTGFAMAAPPRAVAPAPGQACASDLRAFRTEMQKSGYWLGEASYGYGYPMMGYGAGYMPYGEGAPGTSPAAANVGAESRYMSARPGYEIRMLLASANILAQHGQDQTCESVLSTTRSVYTSYAADLSHRGIPHADLPGWEARQIASAKPVSSEDAALRSDQLVGTEVRSPHNTELGSVSDIVMSPHSGTIAYLVIGEGGIFGFGEHYTPVPWADFKATNGVNTLVLDSSKQALADAPKVGRNEFARGSNIDQISQKVNEYWKTHITIAAVAPPK
jgi:sporulation protein YlmC with PRC-barrel domain